MAIIAEPWAGPSGGIGRRGRLKICCLQGRACSSQAWGTIPMGIAASLGTRTVALSKTENSTRQLRMTARLAAAFVVALALWLPVGAQAGPALLFEANTEKVLYAEDPDLLWHPASLTKLMTAYLTFEAISKGELSMADKITCSANANKQPPSKIGLPVGGTITVEAALKILIVKSANDVAVMVAEHVGGSEQAFVDQMNLAAKRLGMTRTNFVNPHGLPDKRQITTARDMARLTRAILNEFPDYSDFFAMRSVRMASVVLRRSFSARSRAVPPTPSAAPEARPETRVSSPSRRAVRTLRTSLTCVGTPGSAS